MSQPFQALHTAAASGATIHIQAFPPLHFSNHALLSPATATRWNALSKTYQLAKDIVETQYKKEHNWTKAERDKIAVHASKVSTRPIDDRTPHNWNKWEVLKDQVSVCFNKLNEIRIDHDVAPIGYIRGDATEALERQSSRRLAEIQRQQDHIQMLYNHIRFTDGGLRHFERAGLYSKLTGPNLAAIAYLATILALAPAPAPALRSENIDSTPDMDAALGGEGAFGESE